MEEYLDALHPEAGTAFIQQEQHRSLFAGFGKGYIASDTTIPKWKESLWDSNSVDPAMLRVPIVFLIFIILWGANVLIFDRFKLQYQNVMFVKSGNQY
jgi:hypothetical protein